jgi:hypothetical protein
MADLSYYAPIGLFIVSEVLPFIPSISGNGLAHSILEILKHVLIKIQSEKNDTVLPESLQDNKNITQDADKERKIEILKKQLDDIDKEINKCNV